MPVDELDPLFASVRSARPLAPAGFADEVLQRDRSERRASWLVASVGVGVLCAAATCIALMARGTGEGHVDADATPGAPTVDVVAPVLLPWTDLRALFTAIRHEYLGVLQSCGGGGPVSLDISRRPRGSARVMYGGPAHVPPTRIEECQALVTAAMVLPPLPEQLQAVTFTLDGQANDATSKDWIDPIATFEKAISVRAMRECLPADRGHMIFDIELVHDQEPHTRASMRLDPASADADSDAQLACLLRAFNYKDLPGPPAWPVEYVRIRVPVR